MLKQSVKLNYLSRRRNAHYFKQHLEDLLYCKAKLEAPKIFSFMALKGMLSLASILDQKHQCRLAEESESCKTD